MSVYIIFCTLLLLPVHGIPFAQDDPNLLSDIYTIQKYWADRKPYNDTPANYWGVNNTGLPYGCGYEQVHHLIRHASKYPSGSQDDPDDIINVANKISSIQAASANTAFTGPLAFLNRWTYVLGTALLVPTGFAEEVRAGTDFWNHYGRLLLNASPGQPFYNSSYSNGTARAKPLLRTTSEQRVLDSATAWATGFFGPYNQTDKYDLLVLYEGGSENNTLAAYDSCANDDVDAIGDLGDDLGQPYIYNTGFLNSTASRLNAYVKAGNVTFEPIDVYGMMDLCGFEYAALGSSDFCGLFTEQEWAGFAYVTDLEFYYDDSYGNAVGRAQGIGYLQEMIARIQNQYITSTSTSVNTTYTQTEQYWQLGQPFYADFTHDDILISVLTAQSVDALRENISQTAFPPDPTYKFFSSSLVPFATRLNTEIIGCAVPDPKEVQNPYTLYTMTSNGYNASNASYKFIRQIWDGAVVPLASTRSGICANRTDGMCSLQPWLDYQNKNAAELANYQYACFANYTNVAGNGDGAVFPLTN